MKTTLYAVLVPIVPMVPKSPKHRKSGVTGTIVAGTIAGPSGLIKGDNVDREKLERIIQAIGEFKPGDVIHVSVRHDDDCSSLKTDSLADCTCKPDVERIKPC